MSQTNQSIVDSYFPVYHKVTKATHILNLNTGEYEKFPDVQKLVFHYMLDRWKFFRSQGGCYFDNQEDIAVACCVVRKTVGKAIKLLADCGYLQVKGKMSFNHRSNSYVFDKELQLAVLDKDKKPIDSFITNIIGSSKLDKPKRVDTKRAVYQPSTPSWEDIDDPF